MSKKRNRTRKRRAKKSKRGRERRHTDCGAATFNAVRDELAAHLKKFKAKDVYVALLTSELWLPNLSSQVKHCFAVSTFAAIAPEAFHDEPLDSYETFHAFITELYRLLPVFPTLEDYAPEPDWGEIRAVTGSGIVEVFYGGSVERIPDFITAFRMKHGASSKAIQDMDSALLIQNHILTNVQRSPGWAEPSWPIGSLQVPHLQFWTEVQAALATLVSTAANLDISSGLILQQGKLKPVRGMDEFGEAILTGTTIPYILLNLDGMMYPISPREAASVVINYWEHRLRRPDADVDRQVSGSIATFVSKHLKHVIPGPFRITIGNRHLEVPAAFGHGDTLYLIIVLNPNQLQELARLESQLHSMIDRLGAVVALDVGCSKMVGLQRTSEPLRGDQVKTIAVVSDASPDPKTILLPPPLSYQLFLPDFVTIFESLKGTEEFVAFLEFVSNHRKTGLGIVSGPTDHFAAFVQSHGMLVGGAVEPTWIGLDPHWGSNWRFESLRDFWAAAPKAFPDNAPSTWNLEPSEGSPALICLTSKAEPKFAWLVELESSSLAFMVNARTQDLEISDGDLLELFVHCLADSTLQRSNLLPPNFPPWKRVVCHCLANLEALASTVGDVPHTAGQPLMSGWKLLNESTDSLELQVEVNLAETALMAKNAADASFEARCLAEWLAGLARLTATHLDSKCIEQVLATAARAPRFIVREARRPADIPDSASPLAPSLTDFKLARKDLAITFKILGAIPGRYELTDAKAIIDPARDYYRDLVHAQIQRFASAPLLAFSIEQFDAAISKYEQTTYRLKLSLDHEVDFDRQQKFAEAHELFVNTARNYRYLLECTLAYASRGTEIPTPAEIGKIVAKIDWLMVLYQASDTLHNATFAAGIHLDDDYTPEVFYSLDTEAVYGREIANDLLGVGASEDSTSTPDKDELERLDDAISQDAGFSLSHLIGALHILSIWATVTGTPESPQLSYRATRESVIHKLVNQIETLSEAEAEKIVDFLVLDPAQILVLAGRTAREFDVPIWEHRKRVHRYAIRPLIRRDKKLVWGAGAASKARDIWAGSLSDGYLPADFPWPKAAAVAESIKRRIELELEARSHDVAFRHTPCCLKGVNFRSRFPAKSYDDVGDFDVLAYWPDTNLWLMIECKYNKPPFCIKDARRLREHIFGKDDVGGHVAKIVRRETFLKQNVEDLRILLGWPAPNTCVPQISNLYVCPKIFYWMLSPPYATGIEFVRLEMLETWINDHIPARSLVGVQAH